MFSLTLSSDVVVVSSLALRTIWTKWRTKVKVNPEVGIKTNLYNPEVCVCVISESKKT